MTDNMRKFLEAVSQDRELTEKLNKAETPEAIVALAAEKGFALTAEDLKPEERTGEVSDEELDTVTGGGECWCAMGGGGTSGKYGKTCACVLAGYGTYTNGEGRCGCGGVGIGNP